MTEAFICDAIRTPIGRYGGTLSAVRADDLGAVPIKALMTRNPQVDWAAVEDVIYGCANQAGEDNRNVARMSSLLAGLPAEVPGTTINRLCGSGMDAVGLAARSIKSGETELMIAGGVESMSRAPFVMPKAECTTRIRCHKRRTTWPPISTLVVKTKTRLPSVHNNAGVQPTQLVALTRRSCL
jgi:acetyl-CoA acyltransferase